MENRARTQREARFFRRARATPPVAAPFMTQKEIAMHVLVTGAAGFIGFHLSRRLTADGHTVSDGTGVPGRRATPAAWSGRT